VQHPVWACLAPFLISIFLSACDKMNLQQLNFFLLFISFSGITFPLSMMHLTFLKVLPNGGAEKIRNGSFHMVS
jgi:hypothetical protein